MRIGWAVASPTIINRLAALKMEGATSPFSSQVVAQFSSSGTLVEHVHELRGIYHSRRDAMLQALERSLPTCATWTHPEGGFFIWVTFPEGVDVLQLSADARARGVELSPGPIFYFSERGGNELRLSYSFANEEQIRQGIAIVGALAAEQLSE
jgi:2-aminoadipate transaminase